jgi:hypothetical protein
MNPFSTWSLSLLSRMAGKTEVADVGFDPGFCVVRVRTQGKSDQHQIPASIDTVQI